MTSDSEVGTSQTWAHKHTTDARLPALSSPAFSVWLRVVMRSCKSLCVCVRDSGLEKSHLSSFSSLNVLQPSRVKQDSRPLGRSKGEEKTQLNVAHLLPMTCQGRRLCFVHSERKHNRRYFSISYWAPHTFVDTQTTWTLLRSCQVVSLREGWRSEAAQWSNNLPAGLHQMIFH